MSGNKGSLLLGLVCVGLIGGLIYRHIRAVRQDALNQQRIQTIESELTETTVSLDQSQQTNTVLRSELTETSAELAGIRQQYQALSDDLVKETVRADAAVLETRTALEEVADRDLQIKELVAERTQMTQRVETLNRSMESLQSRIDEAEFKLTASDGDREFLLRELKRLQTEKAGVERQFNDLSMLRAQVNKLRNELTISRRIEWIRKGLAGGANRKGAELLVTGFQTPVTHTNYNLNVEINQSGGIKILELPPSISPPDEP